jgi:hypothetical protein
MAKFLRQRARRKSSPTWEMISDCPGTLKATYTLLPDGKVLTKSTHLAVAMGEFDARLVFDKQ